MNIDSTTIANKVEKIVSDEKSHETPTLNERAADIVADFGGSWTFIAWFSVFVSCWMAYNVIFKPFDSYPFQLLNLLLSCLSVFQAPFILMSQNRMASIDRLRAEHTYKVDLAMNAKIDLIIQQINLDSETKLPD
jgi:uncharacterized membrane protein